MIRCDDCDAGPIPAPAPEPTTVPPGAWRQLLATTESRILAVGLALTTAIVLALGLGLVLAPVTTLQRQVLVVFPLFVLGWRQLIHVPRLTPMLERLRAAAESGQDNVRRFGIVGLFFFVLVPFWMIGPLVGAVIVFLLGLHPIVNLAVVLSASGVAIALYALFLEPLNAWASAVHPYALFAVIVVLVVLAWAVRRWWKRRDVQAAPTE